jgi:hypothetical protein
MIELQAEVLIPRKITNQMALVDLPVKNELGEVKDFERVLEINGYWILKVSRAPEVLRIPAKTIRRLINDGKLKALSENGLEHRVTSGRGNPLCFCVKQWRELRI